MMALSNDVEELAPVDRGGPAARPSLPERASALFEVLLCSGYPTQLALGSWLGAIGLGPVAGQIRLDYVVALSLLDTIAVIALILVFMRVREERPLALFLGDRPVSGEVVLGLPLSLVALAVAVVVLTSIRELAPWLGTFERNPLQDLVRTPRDTLLFGIVVVIAGGIREEIQRAFLLSRFEHSLGGAAVGVVVASTAFGAGHLIQGADAAIATGVLGAFWAIVFLRRRSIVAPVVSHSGFNLVQLAQFFVTR
jgi:membrane protease YdiL (CAAX protease family)